MKILQLISTVGFFGAENVLLELSKGLRDLKYQVYIGVLVNQEQHSTDIIKVARDAGLKTVIFQFSDKLNIQNLFTLREFLQSHQINVIHSHNYKSNFYGLIASMGLPIKLISTCHNWPGKSLKMQIYKGLDMIQLRSFNKIIAVSNAVEAELQSCGIRKDRTLVINNGIDVGRFSVKRDIQDIRKQLGVMNDEKIVGTVSRLTEGKGHIHIIQAAREVLASEPDTKFLIVGDGPLMNDLKKKASNLPFIFTGLRNDVDVLYVAMDIFILPSLNEGLPMVLLEAMCSGKPVVATKVGDIAKVVDNGVNGLLIEPADEKQLAEAILYLFVNKDKANNMAVEGHKKVFNYFSSTKMAENYLKVYEEV